MTKKERNIFEIPWNRVDVEIIMLLLRDTEERRVTLMLVIIFTFISQAFWGGRIE